jgi:hypothetical protein
MIGALLSASASQERFVGGVRNVDHHAQPVHLMHHLLAEGVSPL